MSVMHCKCNLARIDSTAKIDGGGPPSAPTPVLVSPLSIFLDFQIEFNWAVIGVKTHLKMTQYSITLKKNSEMRLKLLCWQQVELTNGSFTFRVSRAVHSVQQPDRVRMIMLRVSTTYDMHQSRHNAYLFSFKSQLALLINLMRRQRALQIIWIKPNIPFKWFLLTRKYEKYFLLTLKINALSWKKW